MHDENTWKISPNWSGHWPGTGQQLEHDENGCVKLLLVFCGNEMAFIDQLTNWLTNYIILDAFNVKSNRTNRNFHMFLSCSNYAHTQNSIFVFFSSSSFTSTSFTILTGNGYHSSKSTLSACNFSYSSNSCWHDRWDSGSHVLSFSV